MSDIQLSKEQLNAFEILQTTKKNVFIQGQAGSGKSTFIHYLKDHLNKEMVLCSPTAVAAMNIGGMTLHSFFKLPIADYITDDILFKRNRKSIKEIVQSMEVLIIDEVSMVRPDILDAIDKLTKIMRKSYKPFGGIQVVLIGDLYQLPPVITSNTYDIFKEKYGTKDVYFFDSPAYQDGKFTKIIFNKIYRQENTDLIDNLNNLRENKNLSTSLNYFNSCKIEDKDTLKNAMTITPYRAKADELNEEKLKALKGKAKTYKAIMDGSFKTATQYPAPKELSLKKGALVMFNKNNLPEWLNGSTGIVEDLKNDAILVKLISNNETVIVTREEWENKEYKIHTIKNEDNKEEKTITEETTGTFHQFPLQLGWASTIHKAQGKTIDKVIVDIGYGAFAHGQLYVALSRTRNKEDMHICGTIKKHDSIISPRVVEFMEH